MIIAFSGIDGSGKTTCANFVMNYLKEWNLKCRYRHTVKDSFYNFILHDIIGRFSRSSQRSLESGLRNRNNKIYFFLLRNVKKLLLLLNLAYFNLRYCGYKNSIKSHIVCDRYFYDDIVQMMYLGLSSGRFARFYRNLIIQPDMAFFLKVDPENAYLRKSEYPKDYFADKCLVYEDFYRLFPEIPRLGDNLEQNERFITGELQRYLQSRQVK